jgi:hypothetical protein
MVKRQMASTTATTLRGRSARRAGTGSFARFAARAAVVAGLALAVASQTGEASADDCSSARACSQGTAQFGQVPTTQTPVEEIDHSAQQQTAPHGVGDSVTAPADTSSSAGDESAAEAISSTGNTPPSSAPAPATTTEPATEGLPAEGTPEPEFDGVPAPEAQPSDVPAPEAPPTDAPVPDVAATDVADATSGNAKPGLVSSLATVLKLPAPAAVLPASATPAAALPVAMTSTHSGGAPETSPDEIEAGEIRAAEIRAADLKAADLKAADLKAADLKAADLKAADLKAADLKAADPVAAAPASPVVASLPDTSEGHSLAVMNLLIPGLTRASGALTTKVEQLGRSVDTLVARIPVLSVVGSGLVNELLTTALQPVTQSVDAVTRTLVQTRSVLEPGLDKIVVPVTETVVDAVTPLVPVFGGAQDDGWPAASGSGVPTFGGVADHGVTAVLGAPHSGLLLAPLAIQGLAAQATPSLLAAPPQGGARVDSASADASTAVPAPAQHVSAGGVGGIGGPTHSGSENGQAVLAFLRLPGTHVAASMADQSWRLPGSLTFDPGHSPD